MRAPLYNHFFIFLGWFFVILGGVGVLLPVVPTTPFLLVALALFSKSSPRFHQMLLNNGWFGPVLKQWEKDKTLSRKTKYKAFLMIIIVFGISIVHFDNIIEFRLLLACTAILLVFFIWRIKEQVDIEYTE